MNVSKDLDDCLDGLSILEQSEVLRRMWRTSDNQQPEDEKKILEWINLRIEIKRRYYKIMLLLEIDIN